jgi:hypothetical protein
MKGTSYRSCQNDDWQIGFRQKVSFQSANIAEAMDIIKKAMNMYTLFRLKTNVESSHKYFVSQYRMILVYQIKCLMFALCAFF